MKKLLLSIFTFVVTQLLMIGTVLAAPSSVPSQFSVYAPTSVGATQIILSDTGSTKVIDHLKDGDTVLIDVDGANPEYREIVSMNYNSSTKRTQITLATSLKYTHTTSAIAINANKSALIVNLSLNSSASAGDYNLTLSGDYSKLRVGDTLSINPSKKTNEYEFYSDPDNRTINITNGDTSILRVGDSFVINKGSANEEIGIIENLDNLPRITLKKDLKTFYDEFSTHYASVPMIEKVKIRSINFADGSITITTPLRYSHLASEPVLLSNTASSLYEHDSSYANNQSQGNQVTKTYNEGLGQPNEVVVPATNGPHGKYTSNTNACGRCHQLHAAQAPKLIRFPIASAVSASNPIYATCTFCHTYNGQSTYDVKNGQIWDTADGKRYATNGGGFERMLVVEGEPANATFSKVTSKHRVNEQWLNGQYVKFNAPGGYMSSSGHIELTCTSCHQPHGTKNGRQLHEKITVYTGPSSTETRDTSSGEGFSNNAVIINVENPFADETTKYSKEIIKFCTACHYDYFSQSGSSPINGKYRHKMGMTPDDGMNKGDQANNFGFGTVNDKRKLILPLGTEGANGRDHANGVPGVVVCTTCHYAHGTFTTTEGVKQYDEIKLNSNITLNTVGGWETSKNLRLDNRGVCQNCHNRTKDLTLPKLANVLNPSADGSEVYGTASTLSSNKIASYTEDSIIIRFNQYMWTNRMWGLNDSINGVDPLLFDIENPDNYSVSNVVSGATKPLSAKLQPDGRTVILYFKKGDIPAGRSYVVTVNNVADLNWNQLTSESVTLTK